MMMLSLPIVIHSGENCVRLQTSEIDYSQTGLVAFNEDFLQGLLLRVGVEEELNASESWIDCPRCSCRMWKSSALCEECDLE